MATAKAALGNAAILLAGPLLAGLISGNAVVAGVSVTIAEALRGHPAIFGAARPAPQPQRLRLAPAERPGLAGIGRAAGAAG
jgi:hypothetical protein